MPTAAKLFAAVAFAALGFFTAEIFKPHMPPGTQFGLFSFYVALIGLACGWRVLGPEAGRGMVNSANAGLRAALATALVALVIFSTEEMLVRAFRKEYHGPMDAVIGIIGLGVGYVERFLAFDTLLVLFAGGALAGCLSEWASRRWR